MSADKEQLLSKTLTGIRWVFLGNITVKLISVLTTAVLARLLVPADFGFFVMAMVAVDAFSYIKSFGVDAALIQRKEHAEGVVETAFLVLAGVGLCLMTIIYFSAPYIGKGLGNRDVTPVIQLLGVSIAMATVIRVPAALLDKSLLFHKRVTSEMISQLAGSVVSIVTALYGMGVWCLVYGRLTRGVVHLGLLLRFSGWRPKWMFDPGIARSLVAYGRYVFGESFLVYLKDNLALAIIGRMLGVGALGLFGIAYGFSSLFPTYLNAVSSQAVFPAYARLQNDPDALKKGVAAAIRVVACIMFPIAAAGVVLSEVIIRVLYGNQWVPAHEVLRVLMVYGLVRALYEVFFPAFRAIGKPRLSFRVAAVEVSCVLIAILPLLHVYHLAGAALALMGASLVAMVAAVVLAQDAVSISPAEIVTAAVPGMAGAAVMVLGLLGGGMVCDGIAPVAQHPVLRLAILGPLGVGVYVAFLWFFNRSALLDLRKLFARS